MTDFSLRSARAKGTWSNILTKNTLYKYSFTLPDNDGALFFWTDNMKPLCRKVIIK